MGRFFSGKKLGSSGSYPPSGLDVAVSEIGLPVILSTVSLFSHIFFTA